MTAAQRTIVLANMLAFATMVTAQYAASAAYIRLSRSLDRIWAEYDRVKDHRE